MTYSNATRQTGFALFAMMVILFALSAGAFAGMTIDLGNCRDDFVKQTAARENISLEAASKQIAKVEQSSGGRILDEYELPTGAVVDYYRVDGSSTDQPVDYNGSAVVTTHGSPLGQAYTRQQRARMPLIQRVAKWFGDLFVPSNQAMLVPVGMLGVGQTADTVAAMAGATSTIRIAVIGAEFPPWDDQAPTTGNYYRSSRTAFGALDATVREYPMYWNADTNFDTVVNGSDDAAGSEWAPSEYADSPGGAFVNGAAQGLTGPWSGTTSPNNATPPTSYSAENSRQNWTSFNLRNEWWNHLFNLSNPESLTNYYYANSHGLKRIEGDHTSVIGWVRSHHYLDRNPYGMSYDYVRQPGTPLIRPTTAEPGDVDFIVRASVTQDALTVLFAKDVALSASSATTASPWYISSIEFMAIQAVSDDENPGLEEIWNGPDTSTVFNPATGHLVDARDNRRHQWTSADWHYEYDPDTDPAETDDEEIEAFAIYTGNDWGIEVTLRSISSAAVETCTWMPGATRPVGRTEVLQGFVLDLPAAMENAYRPQNQGCGALPNTTFREEDVLATSVAHTSAWQRYESGSPTGSVPTQRMFGQGVIGSDGNDYGLGNRLKTFAYYHNYYRPDTSGYQLLSLVNANGARDDIGGTAEGTRVARAYPFNLDATAEPNSGFDLVTPSVIAMGAPAYLSPGYGHDADAMIADVNRALSDQGINLGALGYSGYIYLFPNSGAVADEGAPGVRMIPRGGGGIALLPENSGLGLTAHETGHAYYGFIDLYDRDFYNNYMVPADERPDPLHKMCLALGPYSVMARGCNGVRVDAYHKIRSGWATPVDVTEDRLNTEIPHIEAELREPVILKLPANPYDILEGVSPSSWNEYFLVENHNEEGYFGDPTSRGLYIYHVDERGIKYVPRNHPQGQVQVDEEALQVTMVQADGLQQLEELEVGDAVGASTWAGDPFPGTHDIRRFSQLPQFISTTGSWSATSATHGNTMTGPLGTTILQPNTQVDSFARVVNISDPGPTMSADVFVKPREIIVTDVSHAPGAPQTPHPDYPGIYDTLAVGYDGAVARQVVQGAEKQGVLAIKLDNPEYNGVNFEYVSTDDVVVDTIKILESGTAQQQIGEQHPVVERAYLYLESNGVEGLQTTGSADARIGVTTFGSYQDEYGHKEEYAIFRNLGLSVPLNDERIAYLAYDIRANAQITPEVTVGAELSDCRFITPAAPGAVQDRARLGAKWAFGNHRFPIVGTTAMAIERPDELQITANPGAPGAGTVAPSAIRQGSINVPLMQMRMHATDDEVIIGRIKVDATSGVGYANALEDLTVIRLWIDVNQDGIADPGTDILLSESNFIDMSPNYPQALLQLDDLTDPALRTIVAGQDEYWLLTVDVEQDAPGAQVEIRVETVDYITLVTNPSQPGIEDVVDGATFPLVSGTANIISRPNPPVAPFTPVNDARITDHSPTFTWGAATDNAPNPTPQAELYYELKIADDPLMNNIIFEFDTAANPGATTFSFPDGVELPDPGDNDVEFYWVLYTVDGDDCRSDATSIMHFTLVGNQAPNTPMTGFWPNNDITIDDNTPTCVWNAVSDPDPTDTPANIHYVVQFSDSGSTPALFDADADYEYTSAAGNASVTPTVPLADLTKWYWRVKAVDDSGLESPWSPIQVFNVDINNQPPVLVAPISEPMLDPVYGTLSTYYELQVRYSDPEGDAPGNVYVTIDMGTPNEQTLTMAAVAPVTPTTNDYRNGVRYAVGVAGVDLGYGMHTWVFWTDNGARLPDTAPDTGAGPVVGSAATIRLTDIAWADVTAYEETPTSNVYVEVSDVDENADAGAVDSVQVTLYQAVPGGDLETVTLTETGNDTGVFQGQIPLRGMTGAAYDGTLNVAGGPGVQIVAQYVDKDDTGNPGLPDNPSPDAPFDMANVNDTYAPAAVDDFAVASGDEGTSAIVNWTWDGVNGYNEAAEIDVVSYRVYYATADFANTSDAGVQLWTPLVPAGTQSVEVTSLTRDTDYWFAVVAVDDAGNPTGPVGVTTVHVFTSDGQPPVISNLFPANGAVELPLNTGISFRVSDMGSGVDTASLTALVNGVDVAGDFVASGAAGSNVVDFTYTPATPFEWNDHVTVQVGISDVDANGPATASWSFDVLADHVDPQVTDLSPADGSTNVNVTTDISFRLTDDKSGVDMTIVGGYIDPASSNVTVLLNGVDITADVAAQQINGNLEILCTYDPPASLLYNSTYQLDVTLQDVAGNATPAATTTWTFDTPVDSTGVAVDQLNPARDAIDVPVDTNISMRLSDAQSGVNLSTLRLWVNGAEVSSAVATIVIGTAVDVLYNPATDLPHETDIFVRVYVKDNVDNETDMTYKFTTQAPPTYVISGIIRTALNQPVAGALVECSDGHSTTTDGNGAYLLTDILAGTHTITPSKPQWSFAPVTRDVTVGPDDAAGVNFTGTEITYVLSGYIVDRQDNGVEGVQVWYGEQYVETDATGRYEIPGLRAGQYTITPALQYHHFDPVNRVAEIVDADVVVDNIVAIPDTFTISGTVYNSAGARVQGVEVSYGDNVAITNEAGRYTLSNVAMGTHTLSASKLGYSLLPAELEVTVPPDFTGADFTAYTELSNSFSAGTNMIGVPGYPLDPIPTSVFETIDVARWDPNATPAAYALAATSGTTNFMRVRPGSGFFVRFANARTLRFAAEPTPADRALSFGINVGWNMVANPFGNPTKFADFQPTIAGGIQPWAFIYNPVIRSYELISARPGINVARDNVQPWEGAWVMCVAGGCSLNVSPTVGMTSIDSKPEDADLSAGYAIPIVAASAGCSDTSSVAGVVPGGVDYVIPNPPTAPATVDVYFTAEDGQHLAHDVRSQSNGTDSFEFVVSSAVGTGDVTVMLPDLSTIPAQYDVMLTDVEAGKTIYARTMQAYTYRATEATSTRHFRIDVAPKSTASLTVSTATATQQANGAVIAYSVSQACKVNMVVRNMAGRCIKVISSDKPVAAGANTEIWNMSNSAGAKVPAGAYLIQIEAATESGQQARALTRMNINR